MTTHGLHMTRRLTGPAGGLMHSALRASVAACGAVICTSEAERSELTALIEAKGSEKLLVVHNGVDAPPAISAEEREAIRRELGVDSEAVLALFVGQLEPRKAPLLAARAVTRARDAGCKLVLAVAGDGPQRAELHSLAGPGVRPLGYRDDVDRLLAAADLFLAPAEREGMSLALLSALRRGLVVVAADGPGNPEAVGDAGLMFGVGDEDALVAELVRAVGDAGLRHSLSAQAVARAEERFSSERFLAATAEVYRRVGAGLTAPDRAASATNV